MRSFVGLAAALALFVVLTAAAPAGTSSAITSSKGMGAKLAEPLLPEPPPPPPLPPTLALTGLPVPPGAQGLLGRPVLAVKIDNARPARPQDGLDRADIVMTEVVEDGITRFLALYQSVDPGNVGPVRSGRDLDALLLPAFTPVLGMSGAAPPTLAVLQAAGLRMFHEHANPPHAGVPGLGALFRVGDRRRPYNMFLNAPGMWAQSAGLPAPAPAWPFDPAVPLGGSPSAGLALTFSPNASASWAWDPPAGMWRRSQDGAAHLGVGGQQLGARNVVLVRAMVVPGSGVDVIGSRTADTLVIGEGEAIVLRDGLAFPARWRKTGPAAQFEWLTPGGAPLPLAPGTTWVELHPLGQPFSLL